MNIFANYKSNMEKCMGISVYICWENGENTPFSGCCPGPYVKY